MKTLKAIVATLGITVCISLLGCGANVVETSAVPSISQVLPQTIAAGSSSVTMKVVGTNFTNNAVILWNGNKLTTSIVDATTLSGAIQGGSLAVPGTAQLQVQNSQTGQASQSVPVAIISSSTTVALPLAISTATLSAGAVGTSYSANLAANGGTSPYKWFVSAGTLPAGLTLGAASGAITGVPTATGTFSFTVTVSDNSSPVQKQSAALSITIAAAHAATTQLTIASSKLAAGTEGTGYSQSLQASGGTPGYSWSVTSGSLPAGLTLAAGSGAISGTPTASGTSTFTVSVSDSSSPVQTKSVSLTITIGSSQLTIASAKLAAGTEGTAYSQSLQASGGTPGYTWSVSSGNLPAGLVLSANSGVISGTPTTSGTSTFTVAVRDSSNPVQTKSATLSITVASSTLTISTSSLSSGVAGTAYAQTLRASGGTPSYRWSITSGSLPAGLSLAAGSGIISGTPTASGTSTFTVSVSDSSASVQTRSETLSLTIAAAAATPLSISTSSLAGGTDGTAYTQTVVASGGKSPYTWSISSGSLPAGLTLTAGTGAISGTPTATGTSTFTVSVIDSSSPEQTASASLSITISSPNPGTTWYVRPDGGTRYSQNVPTGLCNGKADAAPVGTTPDQNCAFNDVRMLYQDGSYTTGPDASPSVFPSWGWVIAGGDTVIIEGTIGGGVSYRIGWNTPNASTYCDANGYNCWGVTGDPGNSGMPPPPSGTPSQPTRILGQNYANCSTGNTTNRPLLTQLYGGYGVSNVINLSGAANVELECLEITEHNEAVAGTPGTCSTLGVPAYPVSCNSSYPLSDYDGNGIETSSTTGNLLLQDIYIHGHKTSGISGPIGGAVTMLRDFIGFNAFAGWNFDDGNDTPDGPLASINANYVTMEGNGCNEQYPIVNTAYPAVSCYDMDSGGFGDSWSGQDTTLSSFTCNHCVQMYNTKDGWIGPHTATTNLLVENSESIGNMGQQLKFDVNTSGTAEFINNLIVGNCNRMSEQIPGSAQNFNISTGLGGSYLSLFCRAAGDVITPYSDTGSTILFANNTIAAYSPTIFDMSVCFGTCGTFTYENNIILGYLNDDPGYVALMGSGELPALYYTASPAPVVTANNNIEYNIRSGDTCGTSAIVCASPQLVGQPSSPMYVETDLDTFDFYPSTGSPAVGRGVVIPTITTDYSGATRPNPPSEGALEPQ